jgi:multidrug efflux system membrane fusion protein
MNMDAAPDSPKEKNLKSRKTGITATAFILLGLGVSLWVGLSFWTQDVGRPQNPAKQEKVPVVIGTATQKTVPVQLHAIGNVEGYASVAIKARVDGELTGVHFQEGQEVKKGKGSTGKRYDSCPKSGKRSGALPSARRFRHY